MPAPAKTYRKMSEGNQNLANVYAKDGVLQGYSITNGGTEVKFVKLYDKASAPVLANDTPFMVIAVPPGTTVTDMFDLPIPFTNGLSHSAVKKLPDTNAEGVAATEILITLFYSSA